VSTVETALRTDFVGVRARVGTCKWLAVRRLLMADTKACCFVNVEEAAIC